MATPPSGETAHPIIKRSIQQQTATAIFQTASVENAQQTEHKSHCLGSSLPETDSTEPATSDNKDNMPFEKSKSAAQNQQEVLIVELPCQLQKEIQHVLEDPIHVAGREIAAVEFDEGWYVYAAGALYFAAILNGSAPFADEFSSGVDDPESINPVACFETHVVEHLVFVDLGLCWSWQVGFDSLYCMLALMLNGSRPALLHADGAYESLLLCRSCQLNLIYHIDAGVL
ncbi:hypothetical protein Nepgr_018737 [Nepenthes gracilis]|uniref:Uncharacterized protein n=1 Tax=Nepenthes gracilis TaxID=150966 RepID=A0AAD3SVS0_NEPGR|nr:hypothetical protein Nepgr_018737 [Nepenthes gracilis]